MNEEQLKGNWHQFKGKVKERWGKLTDDDLAIINGRSEQLVGKLEELYGVAKIEAERQYREFLDECESSEQGRKAA